MHTDNLHSLQDDMVAFIAGLGLRSVHGHITEDVPTVMVENNGPDAWKDFVENAKASGAAFLVAGQNALNKAELLAFIGMLHDMDVPDVGNQVESAEKLLRHAGKIGYLQLGFPHQGIMFLFEVKTEWYETYQSLKEWVYDYNMLMDDDDECDCGE